MPRLPQFAIEHLLLLPVSAAIALVWVNTGPESYYRFSYAISFIVNDVAMVFFFGLMMKEVAEATVRGGVLHPWRRALMPVIVAIGATLVPALSHVRLVQALEEPVLRMAWPVLFAIDVAASYFVARLIFRPHPVIPFLLLLAIASDALGFVVVALAVAVWLRRMKVRSFWPYVLGAGGVSWFALFWGGVHPAFALVPIVPFMPHAVRDPGFFVDAPQSATDTLSRFEIAFRYPAQLSLFFFGLVNAGVPLGAIEEGTLGLPIAVLVGRPLGILMAVGLAVAAGLHLPHRIGWRELIVVGFIAALGFSVGLFFSTALLPPGQLRSETNMGVLASVLAVPVAFACARILRVGRFAAST
jgi:NhaA family Na+:H+ antiporter